MAASTFACYTPFSQLPNEVELGLLVTQCKAYDARTVPVCKATHAAHEPSTLLLSALNFLVNFVPKGFSYGHPASREDGLEPAHFRPHVCVVKKECQLRQQPNRPPCFRDSFYALGGASDQYSASQTKPASLPTRVKPRELCFTEPIVKSD